MLTGHESNLHAEQGPRFFRNSFDMKQYLVFVTIFCIVVALNVRSSYVREKDLRVQRTGRDLDLTILGDGSLLVERDEPGSNDKLFAVKSGRFFINDRYQLALLCNNQEYLIQPDISVSGQHARVRCDSVGQVFEFDQNLGSEVSVGQLAIVMHSSQITSNPTFSWSSPFPVQAPQTSFISQCEGVALISGTLVSEVTFAMLVSQIACDCSLIVLGCAIATLIHRSSSMRPSAK